jgi:hypothetical protein
MANEILWKAQSSAALLTTQLNSLANEAFSDAGAEYDNASNLFRFGDFEIDVTYGTNPAADGYVALHLVKALDGTNYEDGSSSLDPSNTTWVGAVNVQATTSAQKVTLTGVPLPPFKFKAILQNVAGQAMAASGNTVTLYPYVEEVQ